MKANQGTRRRHCRRLRHYLQVEDRAYLHAAAIRIRLPSLPSSMFREGEGNVEAARVATTNENTHAMTTKTTTNNGDAAAAGAGGGVAPGAECADSQTRTELCTAGRVIQAGAGRGIGG